MQALCKPMEKLCVHKNRDTSSYNSRAQLSEVAFTLFLVSGAQDK